MHYSRKNIINACTSAFGKPRLRLSFVHLRRSLLLSIAIMILAPSGMFSQQVTGLFVYHTSGQTFLKWKSSGAGTTSYTVYRSRKPLRTALALARAEQVYHVKPGQTHDRRLSAIIDSPVFFRFPGPSGRL